MPGAHWPKFGPPVHEYFKNHKPQFDSAELIHDAANAEAAVAKLDTEEARRQFNQNRDSHAKLKERIRLVLTK